MVGPGISVRGSSFTTTTGHAARAATLEATDPSAAPRTRLRPRLPTTTAPEGAAMSDQGPTST